MPIWQNVDPGLVTDGVSADTSFGVSRGDFHAGQNGAADLSRGTLPSSKRTADHKYEPCTKKRIRYAFHFFLHKQHPGNFGDSIRGERMWPRDYRAFPDKNHRGISVRQGSGISVARS